ncbi:MAG TPA: NAD(P)-dependent oxidoreductase [Caulobacteraceae bacterium]|nr:NAD(P)-dependent oxidoreductase [Caulobacteraceae bacterium]
MSGEDRVAVVGAGGWLGLATLELLSQTLGAGFDRRVVAFGSSQRTLQLRGGLRIAQQPLSRLIELPPAPTLVLHLAFLTKDRAESMAEDHYVAANRAISSAVREALDPIGACAVFVPSSGAAYAAHDPEATPAARLYGRLKLDDEASFEAWAQAADKRAVIARVFNLSGPYMNKLGSYALSTFILDVLAGRPIKIRARREVFRSYVAIRELMSLVFGLLVDGRDGTTRLDTAGDATLEMADLAETVRAALGRRDLSIDRPALGDAPPDVYVGDGALYSDLRRRVGVAPVDFPTQVRETADYLAAERVV